MFKLDSTDGSVACIGLDTEIFYPENKRGLSSFDRDNMYPILRKICGRCDVLNKCRDWAIKHEELGFWGGMSMVERRNYRKQHRIIVDNPYEAMSLRKLQ